MIGTRPLGTTPLGAVRLAVGVTNYTLAGDTGVYTVSGNANSYTLTAARKTIFLTSGTSFTVPADWNSANNSIEMLDGGGGCLNSTVPHDAGYGGNYRKYNNRTLTPGASVSYSIGQGAFYGTSQTGGTTSMTGITTPATSYTGGTPGGSGDTRRGGGAAGPGGNATDENPGAGSWTSTHLINGTPSVVTASPGAGGGPFSQPNGVLYGGGGGYNDSFGDTRGIGANGIIVLSYVPTSVTLYTLAGATGTYAVSGNAGAQLRTYVNPGVTGSYALTGNAGAQTRTYSNPGVTGTYLLTGNTADLVYTPAAVPGAYTLAGATGTYVVAGNVGAQTYNRKMPGDTGAYVITGNTGLYAANSKMMAGDTGSYTLTGNAGLYRRIYALPGATGTYTITGNAALLTKTGIRVGNAAILLVGP